jgi:hypothetical protein
MHHTCMKDYPRRQRERRDFQDSRLSFLSDISTYHAMSVQTRDRYRMIQDFRPVSASATLPVVPVQSAVLDIELLMKCTHTQN